MNIFSSTVNLTRHPNFCLFINKNNDNNLNNMQNCTATRTRSLKKKKVLKHKIIDILRDVSKRPTSSVEPL